MHKTRIWIWIPSVPKLHNITCLISGISQIRNYSRSLTPKCQSTLPEGQLGTRVASQAIHKESWSTEKVQTSGLQYCKTQMYDGITNTTRHRRKKRQALVQRRMSRARIHIIAERNVSSVGEERQRSGLFICRLGGSWFWLALFSFSVCVQNFNVRFIDLVDIICK